MIARTHDAQLIDEKTKEFQYDFDPYEWVDDRNNIALVNEKGDLNLFQYERPGVYIGHFFYVSRGKEALRTAREMLEAVFSLPEVDAITGLTPEDKLGAKWLTRKLGFKSFGDINTVAGLCELFILTRSDYMKGQA